MGSFNFRITSKDISEWKSTGIYNYSSDSNMNAVTNAKSTLPNLRNYGRIHVYLSGNHFQQNVVSIPNNNDAINIYCVYELDPIDSSRDTIFTIQNALFGAMEIIKDMIIKDMVYVLMKEVNLVIQLLKMVLPILQTVETYQSLG